MASTAVYVGVSFGILNSTIPNLSDVAYDSKFLGQVVCIFEDIKLFLEGVGKGLVINADDKNSMNCWGLLSHGFQVCVIWCSAFCLRCPTFVKFFLKMLPVAAKGNCVDFSSRVNLNLKGFTSSTCY